MLLDGLRIRYRSRFLNVRQLSIAERRVPAARDRNKLVEQLFFPLFVELDGIDRVIVFGEDLRRAQAADAVGNTPLLVKDGDEITVPENSPLRGKLVPGATKRGTSL